jgi:hypothetical protein
MRRMVAVIYRGNTGWRAKDGSSVLVPQSGREFSKFEKTKLRFST